MDYLNNLYDDFNSRLNDINSLDDINDELIKIFKSNLNHIKNEVVQTGKFGGLLKKIEIQLNMIDQVSRLPGINKKLNSMREQSIVLSVGAFEVFISDIFRTIANKSPEYYIWSNEKEKIYIDTGSFNSGFTLGDAIISHLKNKQYSFQDLQSILKAVENYFGLEISLDNEIKDKIIIGTSMRHIIVHNRSIIDVTFLKQTKNVDTIILEYKEGEKLHTTDAQVRDIGNAIREFSNYLTQAIAQRDEII